MEPDPIGHFPTLLAVLCHSEVDGVNLYVVDLFFLRERESNTDKNKSVEKFRTTVL